MANQPSLFSSLVPLALILFVFYFLVMRPQHKQQKEHRRILDSVTKNDEVVTIGGIHATVVMVKDKTVIVRVDDNVKVEIDKSAIARVEKRQSAAS